MANVSKKFKLPETTQDILCMTPMEPSKFVQMQITQAIQYLRSLGVPVFKDTTEYDPEYPRLIWSHSPKNVTQTQTEDPSSAQKVVTIAEFVALFEIPEKPTTIKVENISKEYSATVTKEAIIVGCQTIPAQKFKELIKAAKVVGMIR